jgi:hypothetical protein
MPTIVVLTPLLDQLIKDDLYHITSQPPALNCC